MSATDRPGADLRRYPRARVSRKVVVLVPGARPRHRQSIDVSPFGMKVRLETKLAPGRPGGLSLAVPGEAPLALDAIVWRTDHEGPVFVFVGVPAKQFRRLKQLVDSYR